MKNKEKILLYKASAGSGKTHELSNTFSNYIIEDYKIDKESYKHIMAVTFTKAATKEMKDRILLLLSKRVESKGKDSQIAQELLTKIVHDYSMFKVSTIDSFFQAVIRSFAFEMGRRSSYDLMLDSSVAVQEALNGLYSEFNKNKGLLATVLNISLAKIDKDKKWDFRGDLLDFFTNIFNYEYFNIRDNYLKINLHDVEKDLYNYIKEIYKKVEAECDNIIAKIPEELTCEMFYNKSKSKVFKFLSDPKMYLDKTSKYVDTSILKVIDQIGDSCIAKNATNNVRVKLLSFFESIAQSLQEIKITIADGILYNSYKEILKNFKESSLIKVFEEKLEEYCSREGIHLIENAPYLINKLISGCSTPFIYEKFGTRINHYLLDEFQDTSWVQWKNFTPLINDSVAQGYSNMIVGDVKQSIYRWRGGDWDILDKQIEKEYSQFIKTNIKKENYRSCRNIVDFNNRLFSSNGASIPKSVDDSILASYDDTMRVAPIYSDSKQELPQSKIDEKTEGFVEVISIEDKKSGQYVISAEQFINYKVIEIINRLTSSKLPLNRRYKKSDIAILVSSRKQGNNIVEFLMQNGIQVVSGESLLIESSDSVFTILEILRYISNPKESLLQDVYMKLYNLEIRDIEAINNISNTLSVYSICEIILQNHLSSKMLSDTIFICAFMDKVLEYTTTQGSSVYGFLSWWNDNSANFAIPSPQNDDAVNVMTMHKSKGLAFKVVIVPYIRDIGMIKNMLGKHWCEYNGDGFLYNGPALINYTSSLEDTIYKDRYDKEYYNSIVDCINLMYVTFTRPKEKLYLFTTRTTKSNNSLSGMIDSFCDFNNDIFKKSQEFIDENNFEMLGIKNLEIQNGLMPFDYNVYSYGNENEELLADENNTNSVVQYDTLNIESLKRYDSSKSSLRISDYGEEDDLRHKGILLHKLYSYIENNNLNSINGAVDKFIKDCPSYKLFWSSKEELLNIVVEQITSVARYDWFSERHTILNEREISHNGKFYRADRVVLRENSDGKEVLIIDYKFGKIDEHVHKKQVSNYIKLYKELYNKKTTGYIWYVLENKVIQV